MDPTLASTILFQAPPIRRDMSYRKPVPEYIPSPPPSPSAVIPDLPNTQGLTAFEQHESRGLPPLPRGWQDVLRQAATMTQEKQIDNMQVAPSNDYISFSRHPSFIQSTSPMPQEDREQFPSIPTSPNGTRRRLPQTYRPPTPPISSASKKQKCPVDSSLDNHEYLTVPDTSNLIRNASSGLYPPLSRTATIAAGSSRNSLHPLSTQASFRTEKTAVSDFVAGSARTNNTSQTDGRREDDLNDLPVLPMYIVKPPARRRGSGLTGSTMVGSIRSQKTWSKSCWSAFHNVGCAFRDAFCCCFSWSL